MANKISTGTPELAARTGQNLKTLRKQLGYRKVEMARRLGITAPAYHRYEAGENLPRPKLWNLLQKEFDISMDWLFYNIGPMTLKEKNTDGKTIIDSTQLNQLQQELAQAKDELKKKEALEIFKGLEGVEKEVRDMVAAMATDSILKFEILSHFMKYNRVPAGT